MTDLVLVGASRLRQADSMYCRDGRDQLELNYQGEWSAYARGEES